jgi:hypothetical protein
MVSGSSGTFPRTNRRCIRLWKTSWGIYLRRRRNVSGDAGSAAGNGRHARGCTKRREGIAPPPAEATVPRRVWIGLVFRDFSAASGACPCALVLPLAWHSACSLSHLDHQRQRVFAAAPRRKDRLHVSHKSRTGLKMRPALLTHQEEVKGEQL